MYSTQHCVKHLAGLKNNQLLLVIIIDFFKIIRLLPFPQSFTGQSPTALQLVQQVSESTHSGNTLKFDKRCYIKYEGKTNPGCMACSVFPQQGISNLYKLYVDLIIQYYIMILQTVTLVMNREQVYKGTRKVSIAN